MRLANSAARSPAKTRWVWVSTNPARPPARDVDPLVGRRHGSGRPTHAIAPPSTTTAASRRMPRRVPSRSRSFVTSSAMPVIAVELTAHPRAGRWPVRAGRPRRPGMTTAGDDDPAADETVFTSAAVADRGLDGVVIRERATDQVSGCPGSQAATAVPTELFVAGGRQCGEQLARLEPSARRSPGGRPSRGTCLLEEVDDCVLVRAEAEGRAGVAQGSRRADPVGEVALGRRADADPVPERPRRSRPRAQVGGVHGSGRRPEDAFGVEQREG